MKPYLKLVPKGDDGAFCFAGREMEQTYELLSDASSGVSHINDILLKSMAGMPRKELWSLLRNDAIRGSLHRVIEVLQHIVHLEHDQIFFAMIEQNDAKRSGSESCRHRQK